MYDSYGDGWNGAFLEVTMNGIHVGDFDCDISYTLDSVYSFTGATMDFIFHSGNWDSEITFAILSPIGDTLIYGPAQVIWTTYFILQILHVLVQFLV